MILTHPEGDLAAATWIDLVSPTAEEVARVEAATGRHVPSESEVSEIELSSRLGFSRGAYTVTTPVVYRGENGDVAHGSVGLVLDRKRLLTVRFAAIPAFDEARTVCAREASRSSEDAFLHVFEVLVDKAADALEHAGVEIEALSRGTFADRPVSSRTLRTTLRRIGLVAEKMSLLRDGLLGIGRIASFVNEGSFEQAPTPNAHRMKAIHEDVVSLTDYESHLSNKAQFLLDATLGFISIEQNEVVKALTIASVVGVPPVIVAGIYGMNFRVMPELTWPLGYPFAIALMIVSGLLPLIWFKRRGWM